MSQKKQNEAILIILILIILILIIILFIEHLLCAKHQTRLCTHTSVHPPRGCHPYQPHFKHEKTEANWVVRVTQPTHCTARIQSVSVGLQREVLDPMRLVSSSIWFNEIASSHPSSTAHQRLPLHHQDSDGLSQPWLSSHVFIRCGVGGEEVRLDHRLFFKVI